VGLFDWIGRRGGGGTGQADQPAAWHVYLDGADVVAEDGRGAAYRAPLAGARSVRVVPLTGGDHHARSRGGWQVALALADGDVLLGKPLSDWQAARDLARQVCQITELPLDELTEKLFSRVGRYTPTRST
jgi:hypothetical protein